jgi:hypothetical protein
VEELSKRAKQTGQSTIDRKHYKPNSKPWEIVSMAVILTILLQPRLVKLGFPSLLHTLGCDIEDVGQLIRQRR